jgi:hypothetical protein
MPGSLPAGLEGFRSPVEGAHSEDPSDGKRELEHGE